MDTMWKAFWIILIAMMLLSVIIGKNISDVITDKGLKGVVECIWEGEKACNKEEEQEDDS